MHQWFKYHGCVMLEIVLLGAYSRAPPSTKDPYDIILTSGVFILYVCVSPEVNLSGDAKKH